MKVRLGFVNSVGQQKGVDSLIVTDLIKLARNHSLADAVLLSGDEDLRVGVQLAQEFGVRVHLLGIQPSRGSQSLFLLQESDSVHEWTSDDLVTFMECTDPSPTTSGSSVPREAGESDQDVLLRIAATLSSQTPVGELPALVEMFRQSSRVPSTIDGRLLAQGRAALKVQLDSAQKKYVRESFISACEDLVHDMDETDPSEP